MDDTALDDLYLEDFAIVMEFTYLHMDGDISTGTFLRVFIADDEGNLHDTCYYLDHRCTAFAHTRSKSNVMPSKTELCRCRSGSSR